MGVELSMLQGLELDYHDVISGIALLLYLALLAIVVWNRPFNREARVFSMYLVTMACWQAGSLLLSISQNIQMATVGYQVMFSGVMVAVVFWYHFTLAFVGVRKRWQNHVLRIGYVLAMWLAVLAWTSIDLFFVKLELSELGVYVISMMGPAIYIPSVFVFGYQGLGASNFISAYRRTRSDVVRNRLRYLLLGLVLVILGTLTNFSSEMAAYGLDILGNLINAAIIAYVIFRYQLLDIGLVLRKGLAYSLFTGLLAAIYFLMVFLAQQRIQGFSLPPSGLITAVIVSIGLAIVFQPLRDRVQLWIDRIFRRTPYDPEELLGVLGQEIRSTLDLEELAKVLMDGLGRAMKVDSMSFFVRETDGQFAVVARMNPEQNGREFSLRDDHPLVSHLEDTGDILTRSDFDRTPTFLSLWGSEQRDLLALGAEVFVPMIVKSELLGILALGAKKSGTIYDTTDRNVLITLANQGAALIENARLYSAASQRARALAGLMQASRTINSTLRLQDVLSHLMGTAMDTLDGDSGLLYLRDSETGEWQLAVSKGVSEGQGIQPENWRAAIDIVAQEKEPISLPRLQSDPSPRWWAAARAGVGKSLWAPIRRGDHVLGVVNISRTREGPPMGSREADLLEILAGQAAVAIDNALLFSEAESSLEELQQTQSRLIQAEKLSAVGELVAGVAHELNNPLTGVLGYSQLLLRTESDPQVQEGLERIVDDATRCRRIVQNLLAFARKRSAEKQYVDINHIIRVAVELRAYQLRMEDIHVVLDLAEDLPPTMADPQQLEQVFVNLINNAEYAMRDMESEKQLKVSTDIVNDRLIVRWEDNGCGIPPENMDHIFDPFFTTKQPGEGTGLGLSLSYGIVHDHGGEIHAESTFGEGAAFILELPLAGPSDVSPQDEELTEEGSTVAKKKCRGLVVDDEKSIVQLAVTVLERLGVEARSAQDGDEAWRLIQSEPYDLIILDIKMPGMDGRQVYERIRSRDPVLAKQVVFMTGDTSTLTTRSFLDELGVSYLEKPFLIDELEKVVGQLLEGVR
jgi:signal transduction histidine kinase/CheY-like chemotaxis protein